MIATAQLPVVETAKAVGDELRASILRVLGQDSFGVQELGAIFDTSQPAMSHHLKLLRQAGLVRQRREGTTIFYQRTLPTSDFAAACFSALDESPLSARQARAIDKIYSQRARQTQAFFDQHADALAQQNALICAPEVYTPTVVEQVTAHFPQVQVSALEIGPGQGLLLRALSPYFESLTGVDSSEAMLEETRAATADLRNIELVASDFTHLEADRRHDLIAAAMVLHHLPSPPRFFKQAVRMLQPGGLLVIAELCQHDQAWAQAHCGDLWLGFAPDDLHTWADRAGFVLQQQQFAAQRNGFRVQVHAYTHN